MHQIDEALGARNPQASGLPVVCLLLSLPAAVTLPATTSYLPATTGHQAACPVGFASTAPEDADANLSYNPRFMEDDILNYCRCWCFLLRDSIFPRSSLHESRFRHNAVRPIALEAFNNLTHIGR